MADALTPPTPAPSPAPLAAAVLTRRRSHLDSTSYRTLSRLFSHCFHLHPSRSEGPTPPEPEVTATNPTGVYSGDSLRVPKDADFDRRTEDVENKAAGAGSPSRHVTCTPARDQPPVANPTVDPGAAEAPQDVLVESTFVKPGAVIEEPVIEARVVVEDEALKSAKACLEGEVDESVEEAMSNDNGQLLLSNDNGQLLLDAMMTNFAGLIDDIGGDSMPAQSCGASEGELQSKESEEPKQLGGWTEEERPASNSGYRQIDTIGFEEGEIEGELQDLGAAESDSEPADEYADDKEPGGTSVSRGSGANESQSPEMRCGSAHLIPENKGTNDPVLNKEVNARNGGQLYATRAQAVSYGEVLDWNETPLPDDEDSMSGKKRKRHLTEERKAKKTKNKRKNRAQKRRAEGVHKLKLQPIIKPKTVKPCHFYNHGKCQQGDSCKFSHDFIPSTKSKACKHFATGSCLKGDDCPFDHELSKYPCHKYESGVCFRGDRCKFSHVLSTAEDTPTTDAMKSDVLLAFEKTNLTEQTSSQKTSTVHNDESVIPAPIKQQHSILKNLAGISINSQNVATRIPKGVQFLPFSRGGSNSSSAHQDSLSIEKHRNANGSKDQYLGGRQETRQKSVKQNEQRPVILLDEKNSSKEATLPTDSTTTPGSINTQCEVSEASRILQEFLFGAGS